MRGSRLVRPTVEVATMEGDSVLGCPHCDRMVPAIRWESHQAGHWRSTVVFEASIQSAAAGRHWQR